MVKADDSSLLPEQLVVVRAAAIALLREGDAWNRFPTPVDDLLTVAQLRVAPLNAFDDRSMLRYLMEAGRKVENFLKAAVSKVRGLLDVHANLIHVDTTVVPEKQTFIKLHETGHSRLPHQRSLYRWIQDCDEHLGPETADLFEREANNFASLVLFQDDTYAKMAADYEFGFKAPLRLAKIFGASVYASLREYVRRSDIACALVVLEPTLECPERGLIADFRRVELSRSYWLQFGRFVAPATLSYADELMACVPLEPQRMRRPRALRLIDLAGTPHDFLGEGFRTRFNTFVLIQCVGPAPKRFKMPSNMAG